MPEAVKVVSEKRKTNPPRVALLLESSRAYGRRTLAGVAEYIRRNGYWSTFFQERSFDDIPEWLKNWRGDGILARLDNAESIDIIQKLGIPVVYLCPVVSLPDVPRIITNDAEVSREAFEHLRERGFRNFAFCGYNGADYSDLRREAFADCVSEIGQTCHIFDGRQKQVSGHTVKIENTGLADAEFVARWLQSLPKPVGLMACNDMRGQQLLNACREMGIAVPREVAVVGVDNDEILCNLSDPPLTSVVPNAECIGYEAAEMLATMMAGKKPKQPYRAITPTGIATRRSTEVLAVQDEKIAAVVRFIREHACDGIDVSHILRAVPMSRSTLERRYEKVMRCSLKQDILRFRLDRAKQLLVETDLSLKVIAEKIGLEHTEYLGRIFKKKNGITPARFRAAARVGIFPRG